MAGLEQVGRKRVGLTVLVGQPPAPEVDRRRGRVEHGDGFGFGRWADGVDQCGHDPKGFLPSAGAGRGGDDGVAGDVVGVPYLGLEGREEGDPAGLGGQVNKQATVLPTPLSERKRPLLPWFMWTSWTPWPGRKPKT
ncbi:hypothetical protein ACIP6Q_27820 [Streptomyces bobili]|uniref:hypothetical protein n=1 Tax=Streptomyces bobili TaxID=67280 RepID=UPI0036E954DD